MPKLPDPTLGINPVASVPVVSVSDAKKPSLGILVAIAAAIILGLAGFLLPKLFILPRLSKQAVTLTYWGLWEPAEVMAPVIAKYESAHLGVKINYQMQSKTDYRERLQSVLARKEGPDIMRIHQSWMPMFASELEPAPADILSLDEFDKSFYKDALADITPGGKVLAVPLMTESLGLFVNNEILAATDSGVPATWDDLRKTAFALTKWDEQGRIVRSGMAMGTTNNISSWPDILALLMLQNSVDLVKPNATIDARGRNLGADALKFYTIFATKDRIWDKTLPPDIVAFATGKVAMMIGPSWQVHQIVTLNPKLDFSIHPVPQLTSQRRISWSSAWVEGVSKNSKYKKQSWEFLKYLSSQESLQMMYTEAAKIRPFGEIYPRRDMAQSLSGAKYVEPFVKQAEFGKSWYMASQTQDNGINDEIIAYYEDAINGIVEKQMTPEIVIETVAQGVKQVLTKFGVK
ncbi:extracellular solute-binding protein [Candidatus Collierbacteria bacterium]|nr:extracellular solute-binding protein [Candidatus Collierbacteria bacterium]